MPEIRDPNRLNWRRRLALEAFRWHRGFETRQHVLRYMFWECTLRCNLSCAHCGSDCLHSATSPDMPLSDFLHVLDEKILPFQKAGEVLLVLTGGEPTLRADLAQCGREFSQRGFRWGMVTNGLAMTPKLWEELIAAGLSSLTVSLDGLEEAHNALRGNVHSFSKSLATLRLAAATPHLVFDAMTIVTPASIGDLEPLRELLVATGVRRWRLDQVFPKGRAVQNRELFLDEVQFARLLWFIRHTREEGRIRADYSCEGFLGDWEGQVRHAPFFCRAGINVGSVLADGSISACPSLRNDFVQGNIYRDDFHEIWHEKFAVMRDRSWARTGECAQCQHWKFCHGNGLHLRDESTGELAYCHLRQLQAGLARAFSLPSKS